MSSFWSIYISVITIGTILGCWWLVVYSMKTNPGEELGETEMSHKWDGDLVEYNNPLPKWWLNLFYITMTFGFIYLALYPGLGNWKGFFGWSSFGQHELQVAKAEAEYGPLYKKYGEEPLMALSQNEDAMKIGRNLFANNCALCHGDFGLGNVAFPNLTDDDWIWGGAPEQVKASIEQGRTAAMPAWEASIGKDGVNAVTEYVLSLTERSSDAELAAKGKQTFNTMCVACHGMDGKGNQMLGSVNLTDDIWLYGGDRETIMETVANGRNGVMPAHDKLLGHDKVHLVTAYVLSLSQ